MIIAESSLDQPNGFGRTLSIIELEDELFINGAGYNKYTLSPKPFSFFKVNQNISNSSYNDDTGPYIGMSLNTTCNLCHKHKSAYKRSVRLDTFGGYLMDNTERNIMYFINNKSYSHDSSVIYKINIDTNKILSKTDFSSYSFQFAGQDVNFIYLYNLGLHDTSYIGGIFIYNKSNNTITPVGNNSFSYDIIYDNYNYHGFIQYIKDRDTTVIDTYSKHKSTSSSSKHINLITCKNGQGNIINIGEIYNKETSPDETIQEFNKVDFDVKSCTKISSFNENQLMIPLFSYRESDLEDYKTIGFCLKFTQFNKNKNGIYEFYKEYKVDISDYILTDEKFLSTYYKILDKLINRELNLNIEYFNIEEDKFMTIIISTSDNNSTFSDLAGILLLKFNGDLELFKLISYTPNLTTYSWDGHIVSNDIKTIYQGTFENGITVYKLNETELKYEALSFKSIPNIVEFGFDIADNLFTLSKKGEIIRISSFDTVINEVKLEKEVYKKESLPIETYALITTKNINGEIQKNIVSLRIIGNAVFSNNKKTIDVTGGENVKVPIIIKGTGKLQVLIDDK